MFCLHAGLRSREDGIPKQCLEGHEKESVDEFAWVPKEAAAEE